MRILLCFLQSLRKHPVSAYEHWRKYLINGCQEAGVECVEVPGVDWVEGIIHPPSNILETWRAQTWEKTLDFIRTEHKRKQIDFFLGYFYPQMVSDAAIREIQGMGIPCVNFFCDNVREFRHLPREFRCFDLHWVPEYQALEMYRRAGIKHFHAAMPCWVPPEQRHWSHPETEGITFIGSPDDLRRHLLGQAIQIGADIDIYGMGWNGEYDRSSGSHKSTGKFLANQWQDIHRLGFKSWLLKFERRFYPLPEPPPIPQDRLRGKLAPEDFVRVMQQSTITLGINRVTTHYNPLRRTITYSRLRDIEAPMLGACYLTEWAEDLEHLYDVGSEIETYRTFEDLKEKIEQLHLDPEKRRRLRRAGQARALHEHAVGSTLAKIRKHLRI